MFKGAISSAGFQLAAIVRHRTANLRRHELPREQAVDPPRSRGPQPARLLQAQSEYIRFYQMI